MLAIENPKDVNGVKKEADYIGGLVKRVSNFSMEDLPDRKIFQKTVYLMQAFGINLGYKFNWYLYGVYSPELADVGYAIAERYEDISQRRFTDEDDEERFQMFLEFIRPIKNDVKRLTIASSLHFLHERNQKLHKDQLIEFLIEEKDWDEEEDFDTCLTIWQRLEEYGLVA